MYTCHSNSADVPYAKFPSNHIQRIKTKWNRWNIYEQNGKMTPPPLVWQYLMKQCQVMGVRCQLMIHVPQEIRRNENVINALKQKVLDMYTHWHVNSSWHSDAIWQLRSGSTLAQFMVCCLMAPSHYMNQCWLINWLRDMHLRTISQEVLKNSICNLNEKFTLLKYFEHLPGTDVLNNL